MSEATTVPARATQDAQTQPRDWRWVEATIWTERMLAALENGVKGSKWFSLIDQGRWPKAFFAEQGLFTLTGPHVLASQSRY